MENTQHGIWKKMKILCGCGMNVQAKEAIKIEGYWIDLNLSASGGSYEELENYISDILIQKKNVNIDQNEKLREDTTINNPGLSKGFNKKTCNKYSFLCDSQW